MSSLYADESERLRIDSDEERAAFSRRTKPPASGSQAVVGITTNGTPNDIQKVFLGNTDAGFPTGGTFTLSKTDSSGNILATTVPITWSTNSVTVAAATQAALVTLYGAGNVIVAPIAWPTCLQVTFQGTLTNTLVHLMKCNSVSLSGPKSPYGTEVRHIAFGEKDYPTSATTYYKIILQGIGGVETEGSSLGGGSSGGVDYAFNVGTSIPPIGTAVLCRRAIDGYAFRFSAC